MLPVTAKIRRKMLLALLIAAGLFLTLRLTAWYHVHQGEKVLAQESRQQLSQLISLLDGLLSRFETIPHVLSTNPTLASALLDQQNDQKRRELNLYLEELQHVTEASDIYLVDALGVAVAASNWKQSISFIGQDYSFRPYFIEAISGRLGSYYAVGTSSDKRGFYFSYPIYDRGTILGAIVVKVDIADIEQQATGIAEAGQYEYLITDPDDIVFLSSRAEWRLSSLTPLTQSKRFALNASKRYANRAINELLIRPPYSRAGKEQTPQRYQIPTDGKRLYYMDTEQEMAKAGWRVHVLSPMKPLHDELPMLLLLAASCYGLLVVGLLLHNERKRSLARMQQARDQLEQRVRERTRDLEAANTKLKDTQDELIQAAKLTVIGSLSASINHELNQPLAAIRSYAQNTQTFLARDMRERAGDNIRIIVELTDRLAEIVGQFKSFNRKSQGTDTATDIGECIRQALTIVQPEIDKQGVELKLALPEQKIEVWGDKVRLQQVLVNLMSNAIVAMAQCPHKRLQLSAIVDEKLRIRIQDNGPGVRESQMQKIFEPYYTTNERQGLGLGLSISQRIIESMQGSIQVSNADTGGAVFDIILPLYRHEGSHAS
ncbi:sensor histidine kinase [Shewanella cyperi]|uniref:sensor histidine kinase n=1 Tax=Shewanella cyperi TaxID=2814292 RepID=UPI001A944B03|nr:ATP-binding protein [Shewanella cyperi]QSX39616.1 sensor histidine kinase [Shewanella cyperi]